MKFFIVPGSKRKESWNAKFARLLEKKVKEAGHEVDWFDFRAAEIPVYDDDVLQAGPPKDVLDFKERVKKADGVLLVSPEYNYGVPGPVKNLIDWASRPPATNPFKGKFVAQFGVTPGAGGTLQAQQQIRHILSVGVQAHVLPGTAFTVSKIDAQLEESGLKDEALRKQLDAYLERVYAEAKVRAQG